MKNKFYVMLFYVFLMLCMTGCGKHGEIHEYDDVVVYVDNMDCGTHDKYVSCNLFGKFELVDTNDEIDYKDDPVRTFTLKHKEDGFSFDIISSYSCTNGLSIDGSCYDYTCYLNGYDYYEKAEKYHINKFNERFDYYNKMHNYSYNFYDDYFERFNVITVDELYFVIDYFNSYLDYVNGLDYKFFDDKYLPFSIHFLAYSHGCPLYVDLDENNKYIFKFDDEYYPDDGKLETYIYNFMNKNGINLR